MTFIQIDDDTHIALAAIRSIRRDCDVLEVEFNDGTTRSYSAKFVHHLDDLVGQVIPAAPGWRVASYFYGRIEYHGVVAFRLKPDAMIEPIINECWLPDGAALVDPQGSFTALDQFDSYENEADFVAVMQQRMEQQKLKLKKG